MFQLSEPSTGDHCEAMERLNSARERWRETLLECRERSEQAIKSSLTLRASALENLDSSRKPFTAGLNQPVTYVTATKVQAPCVDIVSIKKVPTLHWLKDAIFERGVTSIECSNGIITLRVRTREGFKLRRYDQQTTRLVDEKYEQA